MQVFAQRVIDIAVTQDGVREHGRNRGPEIDQYCRDIGHDPTAADPWCAIFVSAMIKRASDSPGIEVPFPATAGVARLFGLGLKAGLVVYDPVAGSVFIKRHPDGSASHTGFVTGLRSDGLLDTCEGNTDPGGSREGDGVYVRTRSPSEIHCYIDLNKVR